MRKIFVVVLLIAATGLVSNGQKIFRDFTKLPSPRVDENIIGKYKQATGLYTGEGTKDNYISDSYSEFNRSSQTKFGIDVEASIKKMIDVKLALSDTNYRVLATSGIRVLQCNDLQNLRGDDRGFNVGDEYVVGAVMVGSFSLTKGNDLAAKLTLAPAELSKLKEVFDGKIDFDATSKTYNFRKGSNLIIAEKLLVVTYAKSFDIGGNPFFDVKVNDGDSRREDDVAPASGNIEISFVNYSNVLGADVGEDAINQHKGCLKMFFSHQKYLPNGKEIIICPNCGDQTGSEQKIDCANYSPSNKFTISHRRYLFTAKLRNTMYEYFMTVSSFVVDYKYAPNNNFNNYRMEGDNRVTAKINLSRNMVKFKIR